MFAAKLFLGLQVTPEIEEPLDQTDPALLKVFINNDDAYLKEITYEGTRYLGKFAGEQTDIASLEQLEANIRSLLAKILPAEIFSESSLHLISLVETQRHARK